MPVPDGAALPACDQPVLLRGLRGGRARPLHPLRRILPPLRLRRRHGPVEGEEGEAAGGTGGGGGPPVVRAVEFRAEDGEAKPRLGRRGGTVPLRDTDQSG